MAKTPKTKWHYGADHRTLSERQRRAQCQLRNLDHTRLTQWELLPALLKYDEATSKKGAITSSKNKKDTQTVPSTQSITSSMEQQESQTTPSNLTPLTKVWPQTMPAVPVSNGKITKLDSDSETTESEDEEQEEPDDRERPKKRQKICLCHSSVPEKLIIRMRSGQRVPKNQAEGIPKALLNNFIEYGNAICYHHCRNVAALLDLKTRKPTHQDLKERLHTLHQKWLNRDDIKADKKTYSWFHKHKRPARTIDELGPQQFFPKKEEHFAFDAVAILNSIDPLILSEWKSNGSINIDVFPWWWNKPTSGMSIGEMVEEEFEMFKHHFREIIGENLGWQRNQVYSLGQQLMRQDPSYYILYACLRPDKQWRLISYPYYCKYTKPGDKTAFRHIDQNLNRLVKEGHGSDMIQGSVSIDNELQDDCTEIVPGMHQHTREWLQRLVDRGEKMESNVNKITDSILTQEDLEHFSTDWTPVPVQRGGVRITSPRIPHGAIGDCKRTRRTMLPWFVGVTDKDELEVTDGGTLEGIINAHRKKIAPPLTPSGHPNQYGKITGPFAAATDLSGLGGVSDALVGRIEWRDPKAIRERNIVLGADRIKAQEFVSQWRQKAYGLFLEAYQCMVEAEKERFGEKSYFYRKEHGIYEPIVEENDHVVEKVGTLTGWLRPNDRKMG